MRDSSFCYTGVTCYTFLVLNIHKVKNKKLKYFFNIHVIQKLHQLLRHFNKMIGITIHFIKNFDTYSTQVNRGRGEEVDRIKLYDVLKSKVFANQKSAIKWILSVIDSVSEDGLPHELSYFLKFLHSAYEYDDDDELEVMNSLSLQEIIDCLYEHWNDEYTMDKFNFYESKIVIFNPEKDD